MAHHCHWRAELEVVLVVELHRRHLGLMRGLQLHHGEIQGSLLVSLAQLSAGRQAGCAKEGSSAESWSCQRMCRCLWVAARWGERDLQYGVGQKATEFCLRWVLAGPACMRCHEDDLAKCDHLTTEFQPRLLPITLCARELNTLGKAAITESSCLLRGKNLVIKYGPTCHSANCYDTQYTQIRSS